ncbi:MAG: hypothetical protein WAO08_07990, partial [Hyphomicrobiaceae bacterium]
GGRLMSNEEMMGRMAALEVIAMTALGLHLANIRNDPDHQKSGVVLATMRDALRTQAATLPTEAQKHTICYGDHLLDAVGQLYRGLGEKPVN